MATLFAPKTGQKEVPYLGKSPLFQYPIVPNRTPCARNRLRSSAKTQAESKVDHATRPTLPSTSHNVKDQVWPREHFYGDSEWQLGNHECVVTSPSSAQCFEHDQTWRSSYSQNESPSNQQLGLPQFVRENRCLKSGCYSDFDSPIPPSPSDLEALRETWEQVRVYNTEMSKSASASSMTRSTCSEEIVLKPRGGRIDYDGKGDHGETFRKDWQNLCDGVYRTLHRDSSIEAQLRTAKIWLSPETPDEGFEIQEQIEMLETEYPTHEPEWTSCFWQNYFFRPGTPNKLIKRQVERREIHTLNRKQSKLQSISENSASQKTEHPEPENYYPPKIALLERDSGFTPSPYDVDPDQVHNGYVFSDISYGVKTLQMVSEKYAGLAKHLPTLRLYPDLTHYLENVKIEVKPLFKEGWKKKDFYMHSVRYLTLTGMTMMHEWLKLCHVGSKDETFFPRPAYFCIHLISAVGYTARHYMHTIRPDDLNAPVKYMSCCLTEFDLRNPEQRNSFRIRLNEIHVLHVTTFKKAMQKQVNEILALGESEIDRRCKERAQKDVRFYHSRREDKYGFQYGFSVNKSSSPQNTKSSSEPNHGQTNHTGINVIDERPSSILSSRSPPSSDSEGKEITSKQSLSETRKSTSSSSLFSEPENHKEARQNFSENISGNLKGNGEKADASESDIPEILNETLTMNDRKRTLRSFTVQKKNPLEPVLSLRIRSTELKANLEQNGSRGGNIRPSRLPVYVKRTRSRNTEAQEHRGNSDSIFTASASQASTLQEYTKDRKKKRCQALTRLSQQCPNAAKDDRLLSCGFPSHELQVKDRL